MYTSGDDPGKLDADRDAWAASEDTACVGLPLLPFVLHSAPKGIQKVPAWSGDLNRAHIDD